VLSFVISGILYVSEFCPRYARVLDFTWFGDGVMQWQLLGFAAMILLGSIYEILPRVMVKELPLPKFAKLHYWLSFVGMLLLVIPLVIGGVIQGEKLANPGIAFTDASAAALMALRISTTGQMLLLLGALLLAANIFTITLKWKLALLKSLIAAIKAPLEGEAVSLPRGKREVKA
jgi:cbb3-type cytochrome oxidase subunit 1